MPKVSIVVGVDVVERGLGELMEKEVTLSAINCVEVEEAIGGVDVLVVLVDGTGLVMSCVVVKGVIVEALVVV